jgi:superfamily II DNA or RNA helicase
MNTPVEYIYTRQHESYDKYDACKLGKANNIPERDSQYATGEMVRGHFESVYEVPVKTARSIEKLLQYEFRHLNIKHDAGVEFYSKTIVSLIEPCLIKYGINYRKLSQSEISKLVRCNRVRKIIKKIHIQSLIQILKSSRTNKEVVLYEPRKDQISIIEKSIVYFQQNDKGVLVLMCGVGKTLISLWITQKLNSNTILIGVPNTLLLKQWENVICRLFQSFPYLIVSSGVSSTGVIEFLEHNQKKCIVITTYSSAHKVYTATLHAHFVFSMKINDECFPFETGIQTDTGVIKIGKLYNMFERKEELPLILSFNENDKKFEYKKLTYAWRKENKKLLKIQMSKKIIKCTENHKILTNNGYIEAINLKENDLILSKYDTNHIDTIVAPCLNNDQLQLIYGSYLGHGHLSYTSDNRLRLKIIHCEKQKEYCLWKANMLNINEITFIEKNGYSKKPAYTFQSKIFDLDNEIPRDTKIVPNWLLDKIDVKGIAIWFMDDGSVSRYENNEISSITIHSNTYDEETHIKFISKFKNYDIECSYSKVKEKYYCLKFNKVNSLKLLNLITPYIHSDFNYKISNIYLDKYEWNNKFLEYGTLKITKITNIINNGFHSDKPYVYDIEVEDNHNFIIGTIDRNNNNDKYIDGPIVHNCHHLTTSNMKLAHTTKTYVQMLNILSYKQISLTATLKQLETLSDDGVVVSNDNVEYFGEIIDRKCLLWAITENIICDYVIQTIITNEEQLEQQLTRFCIIEENDKRLFLSAFACLKSISDGHSHHALIYSNNTNNSAKLVQYIKMLLYDNYFDIPELYYSNYHSEINEKTQRTIINDFQKSKFGIITCVYCLGEGWDFPLLDCVVFAENMSSNIRIVQSALRASRKNKLQPNKITKIILPILHKDDWLENNENTDLKKVREVVYQMGLEDETITQKIKVFKIDIVKQNPNPNPKEKKSVLVDELGEYDDSLTQKLRLKTTKRTTLATSYEKAIKILADKNIKSKDSYYKLCDRDNRLPVEPETAFKGQFTNWIDYLSISRVYHELETCKRKVGEYLSLYPDLKKHYLNISVICSELCKLDPLFPPDGLWVEYYNMKDLRDIITVQISIKKKKIGVSL